VIGIVDYGAGNLFSVRRALDQVGLPSAWVRDSGDLKDCDKLLLPGVGHFGHAAERLRRLGLFEPLRRWLRQDRPFLGICLGMQLLYEGSEEAPGTRGLAFLPGMVRRFPGRPRLQIGWNRVRALRMSPLWEKDGGGFYYFVNGYYVPAALRRHLVAVAEFQRRFAAAVARGRAGGVQFHPEKSGEEGLRLLRLWGGS